MDHSLRATHRGARPRSAVPPSAVPDEVKHKLEKALGYLAFKLDPSGVHRDDLIDIALIRIHYSFPLFDPGRGVGLLTYLARCAHHAMVDYIRAEARQTRGWISGNAPMAEGASDTVFDGMASTSPYDDPYYSMLLQQVEMAMMTLPAQQRDCLRLLYGAEDLSKSQVAERLGVSRPRVTQLAAAGLARLRRTFSSQQHIAVPTFA